MTLGRIVIIALILVFLIGFGGADTVLNFNGHWGTQEEIEGHDIDVGYLMEAFNGSNVTVTDVNYSGGQLTEKSPFEYIDPIGEAIVECNDTNIVIVGHSIAPLMLVMAIEKYNQSHKIAGMISLGGMWGGVPFPIYQLLNATMKNFRTDSKFVLETGPESEFVWWVKITRMNYPIVEIHGWVEMIFGVGGFDSTSIFVPRPGSKVITIVPAFHPLMYRNAEVEKTIVEESRILFSSHFLKTRKTNHYLKNAV